MIRSGRIDRVKMNVAESSVLTSQTAPEPTAESECFMHSAVAKGFYGGLTLQVACSAERNQRIAPENFVFQHVRLAKE